MGGGLANYPLVRLELPLHLREPSSAEVVGVCVKCSVILPVLPDILKHLKSYLYTICYLILQS